MNIVSKIFCKETIASCESANGKHRLELIEYGWGYDLLHYAHGEIVSCRYRRKSNNSLRDVIGELQQAIERGREDGIRFGSTTFSG